ncbi:spastin-like [Branchiostoma lanceolatum]|uniref:spastin-like n=1 Tax=Branchiostoma lanceolatum TaxID=7740 RepID=UPI0034549483
MNAGNQTSDLEKEDSEREAFIMSQIIGPASSDVKMDDIVGQNAAKEALEETVVLPTINPVLFTDLRAPARGILLFGPPGNGKTMLAKALCKEQSITFINMSASSLTSKWHGEGEKTVRVLFSVARKKQPCAIFIDEIDSFLCERKEGEDEASRRLKTEFLAAFDGMESRNDDRILVIGATNRPWELDDAVIRRFDKRIYVKPPDQKARAEILCKLVEKHNPLEKEDLQKLASKTAGYSGSDLRILAKDAAMEPIRGKSRAEVKSMTTDKAQIRYADFDKSLKKVRRSPASLLRFKKWNREYGYKST